MEEIIDNDPGHLADALSPEEQEKFLADLRSVMGPRLSKHRRGDDLMTQTPWKMRVEKRRQRAKVAKRSRKANR